jgi:hypothetical protein
MVSDSFANTATDLSVALNGEFGNTRDASVHADGTKSRLPKRVARALRRRNSLRTAIQLWGVVRSCYGFRDCTAHPTQKEQTSGTAPLSSPSHIPQVHRRNSAHTEQSAETTFLTSPSQFPPISFRGATKYWPCPQTLVFYRRGEFRSDLHARERRHKNDCFSSTASRQHCECGFPVFHAIRFCLFCFPPGNDKNGKRRRAWHPRAYPSDRPRRVKTAAEGSECSGGL